MVRPVFGELSSASGARITVESRIDPSDTQFGLQIPVRTQNPGIAIGDACSGEPALIAALRDFREIGSQKRNAVFQSTYILLAAQYMHSQKMPCKAVAKPIARLGLHEPMFPPPFMRQRPTVVIARYVECPPRRHSDLYSDVYGIKGIVKQIGFNRDPLSLCTNAAKRQAQEQESFNQIFHYHIRYFNINESSVGVYRNHARMHSYTLIFSHTPSCPKYSRNNSHSQ